MNKPITNKTNHPKANIPAKMGDKTQSIKNNKIPIILNTVQ